MILINKLWFHDIKYSQRKSYNDDEHFVSRCSQNDGCVDIVRKGNADGFGYACRVASAKSANTIDDKLVTEIRTKLEAVLGDEPKKLDQLVGKMDREGEFI